MDFEIVTITIQPKLGFLSLRITSIRLLILQNIGLLIAKGWDLDIHGYSWIFMDIHGYSWIFIDIYGYLWIFMYIHGYSWIFMELQLDI